jgi:hypothetical protein
MLAGVHKLLLPPLIYQPTVVFVPRGSFDPNAAYVLPADAHALSVLSHTAAEIRSFRPNTFHQL